MEKSFRTIVGGRSAPRQNPIGYPRGIEILLKKAKVDLEFRKLFLLDPVGAARSIELALNESEKKILLNTPGEVIEQMVENTFVPKQHVSTFMSARTAAMLSLVIAATVLLPHQVYSTGVTAESSERVAVQESNEQIVARKLRIVQQALELYKEDHGAYPSTLEWVTGNPLEEYLNPIQLYDPWYRKFHYKGVKNRSGIIANYCLESLGRSVNSPYDNLYAPINGTAHKFSGENPLRIVFPRTNARISLPGPDDGPIFFAAEHRSSEVLLDWYLDSRKIGSTIYEHSLAFPDGIPAGAHWITAIDEEENYSSVKFTVKRR
jgi:hypothetical protein